MIRSVAAQVAPARRGPGRWSLHTLGAIDTRGHEQKEHRLGLYVWARTGPVTRMESYER